MMGFRPMISLRSVLFVALAQLSIGTDSAALTARPAPSAIQRAARPDLATLARQGRTTRTSSRLLALLVQQGPTTRLSAARYRHLALPVR